VPARPRPAGVAVLCDFWLHTRPDSRSVSLGARSLVVNAHLERKAVDRGPPLPDRGHAVLDESDAFGAVAKSAAIDQLAFYRAPRCGHSSHQQRI
jgi:hypothetical protein